MRMATFVLIVMVMLVGISACQRTVTHSVIPTTAPTVTAPLASPVATILPTHPPEEPLGLSIPLTGSAQDCLLTDIPLIREMVWSLETFAWSPTEDALVYVGPGREEDTPLTGALMIMRFAPYIDTPQVLAPNVVGDPTWSPDGSRIAFVALRPADQLGTIMVIDADGSNLLDLLPGDKARTDPGAGYKAIEGWWDEDQIVASTNCGAGCRRPMVLDLQRQTLEPLLSSGQEGSGYAWSPDRASVVVTGGANPQIGVISQNEEEVSWFSGHGSLDTSLASFWTFFVDWSPDSSHLLFLRQPNDRSGPRELWVWNRETRVMSALLTNAIAARWSPQGDQIAFLALGQPQLASTGSFSGAVSDHDDSNALVVGLYQYLEGEVTTLFEVSGVDVDINFIEELTQSPVLVWSPDGEQLAYFDAAGHAILFSKKEFSQYEIPIRGYLPDEVRWSSDGKKLAVQTSGYLQIFSCSISGKTAP